MAHRLAAAKGSVDVEALSPRDANAQRLPKAAENKVKTAAQLRAAKDKEHPPPPPPEVFEPRSSEYPDGATYQVGKLLGKGGFALAYSSLHVATKQKYALKIVKSKMPPKMEQKASGCLPAHEALPGHFQTELQIHSKMKHKNIVQFFRAFPFNNCTYLVLEQCNNGSLMDMVKRRKGLTEPEVRFYSVQITGAIKYMHAKGIIHRDLKMGNIFLDSHMNAKIGDFGLAALVVTGRDMQTIRRTTLCGTPNYIAPEILEKGKKGHDHMVDIWSLGIIMFAMLTSKPPFQSSTTDEIYRRARERDYEWPTGESNQKFISQEAKDLVATMLEDADRRPEPDDIILHTFFTSGYMPTDIDMSYRLRELPPEREEFYVTRMSSAMQNTSHRNLKQMCIESGIGPWSDVNVIHSQVWKEMAQEEKAGLTPTIPLADNLVYRPFDDWLKEHVPQRSKLSHSVGPHTAQPVAVSEEPHNTAQKAPLGLPRQPPQSFAAQQRAQNRPAATSSTAKSNPPVDPALTASQSIRGASRREAVQGAASKVSSGGTLKTMRSSARTVLPAARSAPSLQVAERAATMTCAPAQPLQRSNSQSIRPTTLFAPSEKTAAIVGSKPDVVLERLKKLQAELERSLNSRTMAVISSKSVTPPHPHVVVKWVDYTNKFGLGYILNDGSVGCVLRDIPTTEGSKTAMLPPAGVFIRGAEKHILRREDESYFDRSQPVPMTEAIKFFENNGESGLSEVNVSPEQFRVSISEDGTAGKMNPGKDVYQHRKRERIILWKKFANYMIAYGRDENLGAEETEGQGVMSPGAKGTTAELVTFYQRFGDVGCWVFCDGHLQFNFPDHTKIVLDATGTWCHFWHLPQDAAERLASTGTIGAAALDDRATLSYPLQTLLNFQIKSSTRSASTRKRPEIDPEVRGIPAANDFRRKIEFIKNVVKEWVANGGLGNSSMSRESRLRWTGFRELVNTTIPQKHVWVTIGARWGDRRLSTLVDPRKPWELGEEDAEGPRK
ncbi:cell cycle serine/threonine-protein kinase CDC5/MSD2 [Metarhizium album ARSEF 1941]|uniref:Cell cycle serine/threonine-protein kinase CDC5/MSD2 n=1 Tax=Metarhizium album (strain ARSEF 1941) TaxID=1081103 RepID=A0A0B2WY15_METAS|nr:cell cycle serine/threonine-protein kinase CDC5/MSD2 [Metarhizium album ARSEF 1941]KHN98489.1 cell cycle serine/threonine-protein kinase CDC5/MSD2 [Metarhizium album ARSEF 1941]